MEQTETYGLNKPGSDDPISPVPLNENADKVDAALAALAARITPLETSRYKFSTYKGTGTKVTVSVGFKPSVVIVACATSQPGITGLAIAGSSLKCTNGNLAIVSGGFEASGVNFSTNGQTYNYLALR